MSVEVVKRLVANAATGLVSVVLDAWAAGFLDALRSKVTLHSDGMCSAIKAVPHRRFDHLDISIFSRDKTGRCTSVYYPREQGQEQSLLLKPPCLPAELVLVTKPLAILV
jgi:hypothetical protein